MWIGKCALWSSAVVAVIAIGSVAWCAIVTDHIGSGVAVVLAMCYSYYSLLMGYRRLSEICCWVFSSAFGGELIILATYTRTGPQAEGPSPSLLSGIVTMAFCGLIGICIRYLCLAIADWIRRRNRPIFNDV